MGNNKYKRFFSVVLLWLFISAISCKHKSDITYILFEAPPANILKDIHGIKWPEDPESGVKIRLLHDSASVHEQVMKGTVTRGTYVIDTLDRRRQFIYTVYHPDRDSGCNDYAWYSWVYPRIEIEDNHGNFRPATYSGTFKAATGNDFGFGKWNKDYQKKWVDSVNEARRRNGEPPLPVISPSDSLKKGQPYAPFPTPDGNGFLDSPSFSGRGEHGELSIAERIMRKVKNIKDEVESLTAPPDRTIRMRFTTRGRTYLYCIRPTECLGRFNWTSVEIITIQIHWVERGIALGNDKKWVSGSTLSSSSTMTMGPWQKCRQ